MLDYCLLGTGGMMPLPKRYLTSLITRYNGSSLLIDCGEGTQIALKASGISPKPIDVICITHFHADHVAGLPGFLLTMGNAERTEDLLIIGPKGVPDVVKSLCVVAQELPFKINYIEITEDTQTVRYKGYVIEAFKVDHRVTCYGYTIRIERAGRFDAVRARTAGIPLEFWSRLQKGEIIEDGDKVYTPDMVLGPDRKGIKLTYCTDSRPVDSIVSAAGDADLFICEGMYGDEELIDKARRKKHMMMSEAANLAKKAGVKELWYTHYSPSVIKPDQYLDAMRGIFPNCKMPRDGWYGTLTFEEGED